MDKTFLYTGIFLILLGIAIKYFKLYFLIAGYNTMNSEGKAKVNIQKVATLLRNVLAFIGLTMVFLAFGESLFANPETAGYILQIVVVISVIFLLIKSNSKAYKN